MQGPLLLLPCAAPRTIPRVHSQTLPTHRGRPGPLRPHRPESPRAGDLAAGRERHGHVRLGPSRRAVAFSIAASVGRSLTRENTTLAPAVSWANIQGRSARANTFGKGTWVGTAHEWVTTRSTPERWG